MDNRIISRQTGMDGYHKIWHVNGKNMIIYMHSDGGSIVCNEKIYPIKKGALCFIGAQKYHYTMTGNTETYERSKLFISDGEYNWFNSFFLKDGQLAKAFNHNAFVYAQIPESDISTVDALFKDIADYADSESCGDIIFASGFMRLLVFIKENAVDAITPPHGSMYKALEYINAHIKDTISIDGICAHLHTSKYHFCRSFKKATGLTVMDYIVKTRMTLAKNMLANDSASVSEVSECCGFSSVSCFCRVFKEKTSLTPLQYRKSKNK